MGAFVLLCGLTYTFTDHTKDNEVDIMSVASEQESNQILEDQVNTGSNENQEICVYICGCIGKPGVYMVNKDTRVYTIIEMAGGLTQDAFPEYLNLAEVVTDGQKIVVPSIADIQSGDFVIDDVAIDETDSLLNINTASEESLMSLPGIGSTKALSIITYRDNHGNFNTIEEIMNVEGIKENLFNKIKELIKV